MANISLNQDRIITNSSIGKFNIKQISKTLLRRRFFVLGISGLVMSIASLLAVITKPNYQSSMEIIVSSNLYNIQGGASGKFTKQNPQAIDYTSQMKFMLSSQLIEKAVVLLHTNYPDITLEDIKGKQENGKKALLEVIPIEGEKGVSQVFEVSFNGDDPVKTQRVLQALQKVYQTYNKEQQKERLKQGLAFVHIRLTEIKKAVNQAEKNLEQFRKKHNLVDPQVQSKVLIESLADVQKQLQTIRAQLQDVRTQYNSLEQKMASLSQNTPISFRLNQSSRYQSLLSEIQKTELALSKEELRYTDDSPTITGLKQQRQSQIVLLRREIERLGEETNNNKERQLAEIDPQLAQDLIQVQTTALGLIANEKSLAESEQQIRSELSKYPSLIAEYNRLISQIDTNRKTLEELMQTQQSLGLKITQGGVDWQVLEEPLLGVNISNDRLLILLGGVVIGPALGVALALIWGLFNRVIYSPRELQKLTNLQLIGSIPKLAPRAVKKRLPSLSLNGEPNLATSVVEATTWLPCHEALDMVYQNIQIFKYPFPLKSLIITSALPGEGKTTLVLGLAASAAHMHKRVLVIDANLRDPHLHNMLQLSNDWGLSLLLVDEENTHIQDYIQPIHPSIDILTAGPIPEDTVELFSSQRMQELIQLFEQTYDLVLIDAPSILGTVDTRILASFCNGIMMVGRIGQITQTQLVEATEILSKLNLIGIIANEVRNSQNI